VDHLHSVEYSLSITNIALYCNAPGISRFQFVARLPGCLPIDIDARNGTASVGERMRSGLSESASCACDQDNLFF
jgi:hypothetical protein